MSAADIGLLLFFAAAFAYDGLRSLNRMADRVEDQIAKLPSMAWFHWHQSGDPATWLQHGLWTLVLGGVDALSTWALLGESPADGLLHGVRIAVVLYIVRESYEAWRKYKVFGWKGAILPESWPKHTGWLVDAIGDVAGPMVTLAVTRILA